MAKLKTFNVQRRFDLCVGMNVSAASFEDAVSQAKNLKVDDFVKFRPGTDHNWSDDMTGMSVSENS